MEMVGVHEENQFNNGMASEWNLQNPGRVVVGLGDLNRHLGRWIDGFGGGHGGYRHGLLNSSIWTGN